MDADETLTVEILGARVILTGELDMQSAPRFYDLLLNEMDGTAFEVDLSGVTFIDSSGLHALVRLRNELPSLRLVALSERVQHIFELTGTGELFEQR